MDHLADPRRDGLADYLRSFHIGAVSLSVGPFDWST